MMYVMRYLHTRRTKSLVDELLWTRSIGMNIQIAMHVLVIEAEAKERRQVRKITDAKRRRSRQGEE